MSGRWSAGDQARRRAAREIADRCLEVRDARLALGLRQRDVAAALRWSASRLGRLERGELPGIGAAQLAAAGGLVGLQLSVRFYPVAGRLRDGAQVQLSEAFQLAIAAGGWDVRLEAPVGGAGDGRAFDMLLSDPTRGIRIAVELFSRFRDLQAQWRPVARKLQDAGIDRVVLVLLASHANREAVREAGAVLRNQLPLNTRQILHALGHGRDPGANGIVFLGAAQGPRRAPRPQPSADGRQNR